MSYQKVNLAGLGTKRAFIQRVGKRRAPQKGAFGNNKSKRK